jgi:hypothetical protein
MSASLALVFGCSLHAVSFLHVVPSPLVMGTTLERGNTVVGLRIAGRNEGNKAIFEIFSILFKPFSASI